jgi:hypothetical protein
MAQDSEVKPGPVTGEELAAAKQNAAKATAARQAQIKAERVKGAQSREQKATTGKAAAGDATEKPLGARSAVVNATADKSTGRNPSAAKIRVERIQKVSASRSATTVKLQKAADEKVRAKALKASEASQAKERADVERREAAARKATTGICIGC